MRNDHLLLALLALGCSSSTSLMDAGLDAAVDAPFITDAGVADSSARDAGDDAGQGPDAGIDAALPDVGVDAGPLSACTIEYFAGEGDGCFCMGPLATSGRYLYRQSLGIEVYDAEDPENLVRLMNVDERPSANGHIAVRGELLISALDFEDDPLRLYSLSNPAAPTEVARFGNASVRGFAAGDRELVIIEQSEESEMALVHYRLSSATATETWRSPLADLRPFTDTSVAIAGGQVFITNLVGRDPATTRIRRFDEDGVETLNVIWTGRVHLFAGRGELYALGGEARVARLNAETLETEASFGEAAFAESLLVRDDVIVLGGSTTVLERSTLRELPSSVVGGESARGFVHVEAGEGEVVFGSGGNGVIPFSLHCE